MYKKYTKFDIANMKMAFITADLSYALRRKVGAIIVSDNRIIANGYNGTITGTDNNCEDKYVTCGKCGNSVFLDNDLSKYAHDKYPDQERLKAVWSNIETDEIETKAKKALYQNCNCDDCKAMIIFDESHVTLKTNNRVIHAEQNALLFAARKGISVKGATMYVTSAPCIECAKAIAESGIKMVIWKEVYKDLAGPELLNDVGVECYRYDIIDQ